MSEVKRYAIIIDNQVINVALWDGISLWQPDGEIVELPDDSPVGPGYVRDGKDWVAPPPTAEQLAMQEAINKK